MKQVVIALDTLRKWQTKLEDSGEITVSEEIYDFISAIETKVKEQEQKKAQMEAKKLSMKDIEIGKEYRISTAANFKSKYKVLNGATVRIMEKKRTNVGVMVTSNVPGFTNATFLINVNVLERL